MEWVRQFDPIIFSVAGDARAIHLASWRNGLARETSKCELLLYMNTLSYWTSEASPTLGCSIEISHDKYMCMMCLSYVKLTA